MDTHKTVAGLPFLSSGDEVHHEQPLLGLNELYVLPVNSVRKQTDVIHLMAPAVPDQLLTGCHNPMRIF
jgi:hypothetical protein